MRLSALLAALPPEFAPTAHLRAAPAEDPVIHGIQYDSRAVTPGDLFVALRGAVSDGHTYLDQALALGAVALLVEAAPGGHRPAGQPIVIVPDCRRALAPIACRFYGEPAAECRLIGITGTNGKTSASYLVESILARSGVRTGLVGTVEIRFAGQKLKAVNTTPESLDLQRTLRAMRTERIDAIVMEVSSHGLELGRVSGCRFSVGAFTNLTQDHLDFHGSMDAYLDAKTRLFREHLVPGGAAVVNRDDPASEKLLAVAKHAGARCLTTSCDGSSDAHIRLLEADVRLDGSRARVALPSGILELEVPLVGDFNLENTLIACGIAEALGTPPAAIRAGVASCPQVPGRVQRIGAELEGAPTVFVDYAHTPDAIEKLLRTLRPLCRGRLITVFGCGGDRDRAKRALMARAVARYSDRIVATSDNPRSEEPRAILRDIEVGLAERPRVEATDLGDANSAYCIVVDRREAIELAIALTEADDTVVIAGKGHEDYQIVGREKLPFDDREEVRHALARKYVPRTERPT